MLEGPRCLSLTPVFCSYLCNISGSYPLTPFRCSDPSFLFIVLLLLMFSSIFLFHMPPPLLTVHKRVFYLFHQNAEGLGVCVPHTKINFSSASGTKQNAMLIVASIWAHKNYRAHLSSTSLPSWETFCSHSTAIIVNHCAQVMRCEHSWQMSDGHVYIISSKMKKTQTRTLSVCRYLFNDSEMWVFPLFVFLTLIFSRYIYLLLSCSLFFFVCQRTIILLRSCFYISGG